MKKIVAILLVAVMLMAILASCSNSENTENGQNSNSSTETGTNTPDTAEDGGDEAGENEIKDLVVFRTGHDVENFLSIHTENAQDALCGVGMDNWIGVDNHGNVTCLLAEDYSANEDSSVWTFTLRDGVKWVDKDLNEKADLTVTDFLVGAEFILNYHKNSGYNASMLMTNVEGAQEYYEYTRDLSAEEAYALTYEDAFADMVGIKADTEANTVTYTCVAPTPYFWSLGYHKSTSPLAEGLVDEIGAENMISINWDELWYTGAYVITEFIAGNTCVLTSNTKYWNYDNVKLFDTVTSNLIESTDVGYQLYLNGEIDYITLSQANVVNILGDESGEFYDNVVKVAGNSISTYVMHFNYQKIDSETGELDTNWNTAIANENFRMAMYWGLDLEGYFAYTDSVTPFSVAGYTMTQTNFVNVEGMDYQDYVVELLGLEKSSESYSRYNPELAQEYLDKAVEELTAAGVTFPIKITNYIKAGNQSALDQAVLLKDAFDNFFGEYVQFENGTYVSSLTKEVISLGHHNYVISSWSADYSDPSNCIEQCSLTAPSNVYLEYSFANKLTEGPVYDLYQEFTDLCMTARNINNDLNERYKAYAEAEAFMIEHNLAMPLYSRASWQLTKINDYSKAIKGQSYQNWETNSEGYTQADYEAFAAEKAEAMGD